MEKYKLKQQLRIEALQRLSSVSQERREEAKHALLALIKNQNLILSFCSFGTEIDTSLLNQALFNKQRLLLPRLVDDNLHSTQVLSLDTLIKSKFGILQPPEGPEITPSLILVPALLFDKHNNRLGRGKGFYDRFLALYPHIPSIGIGFKEQLYSETLPTHHDDLPVNKVMLF